jgi:hypothetical protein
MLRKTLVASCCTVLAACGGFIGETGADGPIDSSEGRIQMDLTGSQMSSGSLVNGGATTGSSGPVDKVAHINVTISKVTAHSASQGWVELFNGTPVTIDLLDLQNNTATLGFKNMPAGKITQIRLYTTEGATQNVVLKSGETVALKVPSGLQSGIKVKGLMDLKACTKTTLAFGFVGHKSIWVHPTGQGDLWILRPVIHASTAEGQPLNCNSGGSGGGNGAGGSGGTNGTGTGGNGGTILIENGGTCTSAGQCAGGACINGVCGGTNGTTNPGLPNGSVCTFATQCSGGQCVDGLCTGTTTPGTGGSSGTGTGGSGGTTTPGTTPLIETGGSCSGSSQCLSGSCVNGVCQAGGSGSACNNNLGCLSGLCQAGTCAPPTGAGGTGSVCSGNVQCLSGTCINGVCDPGATGQPCRATADCTSGLSCVQGTCVVPIN